MLDGLASRVMDTLRLKSVGQPLLWGTLSLLGYATVVPNSFFLLAGVGLIGWGLIQGVRRFFKDGMRRAFSSRDNAINLLARRARKARDRRTKPKIRRLDKLLQRMHKLRGVEDTTLPLGDKLHLLWDRCFDAADQVVALRLAAQQLATQDAREQAMQRSHEMRDLLARGLDQLEAAVDRIHLAAATGGHRGEALRELSDELDRNLEVARRVE
ncbi:MAG: hypothetical protein AAGK78_11065, partial [Planctomycetota bacterium]